MDQLPVEPATHDRLVWSTLRRMAAPEQPVTVALGDGEARFRVLTDLLPQIVWMSRPGEPALAYINTRWCEFTGMSREDSLVDARRAVHPEDLPQVLATWAESVRTGAPYEATMRLRRADGEYRWFLARNAPARDADGRILYWLGTSTDIHERVLVEQDTQALGDLTERLRVGDDADALLDDVCRTAAGHLGLWRAYVAEVDEVGRRMVIPRDYRRDPDAAPMAGANPMTSYSAEILQALAAGHTVAVPDTATHPLTAARYAGTYGPRGNRALLVIPLLRDARWVAALVACHHQPHAWTAREVGWLETVGDRAWHAVERLRLRAEHRRSEERYRAFLEHSAEGIWRAELDAPMPTTLDEDAQLDFAYAHVTLAECNDAMARMYGYERGAELQGVPLGALLPREDPANAEYLRAFFRSGYRLVDAKSHEMDRYGHRRWFLNSLVGVIEDGCLQRVWGTQRDITDQQHAERDTQFLLELDAALASLSDADAVEQATIARLAAHLDVDQCCFGHAEGDRLVVRFETRRAPPSMLGTHPRPDVELLKRSAEARHGTAIVLEDAAAPGTPDAAWFARFAARGILTVQVRYQDRWAGALACVSREPRAWRDGEVQLAREVAARVWPLMERARALQSLREADRRKDEFLAMLAHELRNPLAPIRTAVEVLRDTGGGAPDAARARDVIERQARVLTRLVDDLLDVSRFTRGTVSLRRARLDLRDVVRHAVETHRDFLDARGHHVRTTLPDTPIPVDGDHTRLVQVVGNLLHNAAKYTDVGGTITVEAGVERDAWVRVRDDGIGIPADLLPHVFDLFAQADRSLDRSQGGLGIGLTLSRQLVLLHGGSIVADSGGPGQGSEFTIRLPLDAGGGDTPAQRPAAPAERAGLRVVVVEDNRDAADMLALLLSMAGHEVRTAPDGPTALALVATGAPPDVMLCDIGLPGLDGYQLAARLRALPDLAGTRLIALTGYGRDDDRARALAAGFDDHLTKPVEPSLLAAKLRG
jgi:PAS domain S-box-containing protein